MRIRALLLSCSIIVCSACGSTTNNQDSGNPNDTATPTDNATPTDVAASALCMEYCSTAQAHCDGANQLYPSNAACLTACAAFPVTGMRGDTTGNSIYCRLYHVDQPAAMNPATHCPHAGPSGGGVCQ